MHKAVGLCILTLAAAVALVHGNSVPEATGVHIETLVQKLEDHYYGRNLNDEITFAECQASFEDFEELDDDNGSLRNPARNFLNHFMFLHLKSFPEKTKQFMANEEAAKEFVKTLEATYKRFRPIYNFEFSLKDSTLAGDSTKLVINHLAGKGELPSADQADEAEGEMMTTVTQIRNIVESENIYEYLAEFERLNKYWLTPEAYVWTKKIWPLFYHEQTADKFYAGDGKTILEVQQVYQNELNEFVSHQGSN